MSDFFDRMVQRAAGTEPRWHVRPRSRYEPAPGVAAASGGLLGDAPQEFEGNSAAAAAGAYGGRRERPAGDGTPGAWSQGSDIESPPVGVVGGDGTDRPQDAGPPGDQGQFRSSPKRRRDTEDEIAERLLAGAGGGLWARTDRRPASAGRTRPADAAGERTEGLSGTDRSESFRSGRPGRPGRPADDPALDREAGAGEASQQHRRAPDAAAGAPGSSSPAAHRSPGGQPGAGGAATSPPGQDPASWEPIATQARGLLGSQLDGMSTRRRRSGQPDDAATSATAASTAPGAPAAPDTRTLLQQHVVPALRARGLLGPAEHVDVGGDGNAPTSPRRTAVLARDRTAGPETAGRTAGTQPEVHVHIGTVQVLRPAPPPSPTADAAAVTRSDPASERLAAFLAGRRSGR